METMSSLAMFLFAAPASYLMFRYGVKRSLQVGLSAEIVARVGLGLCGYLRGKAYFVAFTSVYFLEGCSSCMCQTAIIAFTLRVCPEENRNLVMSCLVMLLALGIACGSFVGAAGYDLGGFGLGFYFSAIVAFFALNTSLCLRDIEDYDQLHGPTIDRTTLDVDLSRGGNRTLDASAKSDPLRGKNGDKTNKRYLSGVWKDGRPTADQKVPTSKASTSGATQATSVFEVGTKWLSSLSIPSVALTALLRFNMEVYFEWEIILMPQHFSEKYGVSTSRIAALTSGIFVTIAIFSPVAGMLGQMVGNLTVLVSGLFILSIGTTGLGPTTLWEPVAAKVGALPIEITATVFIGIGLAFGHAPIGAFLANSVQAKYGNAEEEVVAGIMSLSMALGACVGPMLGSGLMSATNYETTALIHALSQLALFFFVILLWGCGRVTNDLNFQRRSHGVITKEALRERSVQVMPWGGFKFNYAFTDSMAFPPPIGTSREEDEPRFFSLHFPGVARKRRKNDRRSKSLNHQND